MPKHEFMTPKAIANRMKVRLADATALMAPMSQC